MASVGIAHAGGAVDVSGVAKGTTNSEITPIDKGHVLINIASTYKVFEVNDPSNPFKDMTGKCWGAFEIKAQSASGSGNCAFTDASGDKNYNYWTANGLAPDGAVLGTWTLIAGTGKYLGASGGGGFHSLTDREKGTAVNTVTGAITLK